MINIDRNHSQLRKFSGLKNRGQGNTQGSSFLLPKHSLRPVLESGCSARGTLKTAIIDQGLA